MTDVDLNLLVPEDENLEEPNEVEVLMSEEDLELNRTQAIQMSNVLFSSYPISHGQLISKSQRDNCQYYDPSLAYGEISLETLDFMFCRMAIYGFRHDFGGKFVDIGSGLGRIVIAGMLLHDFDSCLGIEILSDLCDISKKVKL